MADTYAEFVQMMREQGAANNGPSIELAVMTGPKSCKIGTLQLSGEDLYIPDRLMSPACTGVKVPAYRRDSRGHRGDKGVDLALPAHTALPVPTVLMGLWSRPGAVYRPDSN